MVLDQLLETRFQIRPHVRSSHNDGNLVLLDVNIGALYTANATGARVWQQIEQGVDASEIAGDLAAHYGISLETAGRGVRSFLFDLVTRGLIACSGDCHS